MTAMRYGGGESLLKYAEMYSQRKIHPGVSRVGMTRLSHVRKGDLGMEGRAGESEAAVRSTKGTKKAGNQSDWILKGTIA